MGSGAQEGRRAHGRSTAGEQARWRRWTAAVGAVVLVVALAGVAVAASPAGGQALALAGTVESGGVPLPGYEVALYRTVPDAAPELVGTAITDAAGAFTIGHDVLADPTRVTYLVARDPSSTAVLATVLGAAPGTTATVNPRTTVAFAWSTAAFLGDAGDVVGPVPGVPNGASMAKNLADPVTGAIGVVLDTPPNGDETSTRRAFNSLANAVAACVADSAQCDALRTATTPAGQSTPPDLLAALGDLARQPTLGVDGVFTVSQAPPTPYAPARADAPDQWTLALRFDGGPDLPDADRMNGPGNFAMDHEGTMWVADNYTYAPPGEEACAGQLLLRFAPDGSYAAGSPLRGGGLSGAGYGIVRDRYGDIWVSNFGFAATECVDQPPHTTLSQFTADGTPVSPPEGFSPAGVDWPQGMAFSPGGDLWVANCAGDSVTVLEGGDPARSRALTGLGVTKPFDVAFGSDGNAYVTGTESDNVAVVGPDGTPVPGSPFGGFHRPMGITASSTGELWIANSGLVDLPCPSKDVTFVPPPSLGYWDPATGTSRDIKGTGGLFIPWGISVDGHDNVWVSNFGGGRVSGFCGRDDSPHCPAGVGKGDALADVGFTFDGLRRSTATATDTAGNVWVTNNWKQDPAEINPGGYQVVVFLGIGGPVQVAPPEPRPAPPSPVPAPVVVAPRFTG